MLENRGGEDDSSEKMAPKILKSFLPYFARVIDASSENRQIETIARKKRAAHFLHLFTILIHINMKRDMNLATRFHHFAEEGNNK